MARNGRAGRRSPPLSRPRSSARSSRHPDHPVRPLLAEIALKFGPPEFFAIQLLTFSSFIGLGGGNPIKSLVSILLGFILASAGLDIVTGQLASPSGSPS